MQERFPELWNFLGAYLHQDWYLDYADWGEAFDDFVEDTEPAAFIAEIDRVLTECTSETELADLLIALGMGFRPKGADGTARGWVLELRDRCAAAIRQR